MNFYALDIETESLDSKHPEYALQPWRVQEGRAKISVISYTTDNLEVELTAHPRDCVGELAAKYVWTWNSVFDIAFLIASGVDCSNVRWLDAMSAFKWACRSQATDPPVEGKRFSWSLGNAAKVLLKNWEHYEEYLDIKEEMQDDQDYWKRRCRLDTEATLLTGKKLWSKLTPKQHRSFLIEQEMLYPTALAWVNGCRYDMTKAGGLEISIMAKRKELLNRLGVDEKVLDSPKQLSGLIYDQWGVPFDEESRTPKGEKSVSKGALTFLIEKHSVRFPQLSIIQKYRENKSKYDKFIAGPQKIRKYLNSDIFHHNWRVNSTYTGRCTVASKSQKKFPIGLPLHQIPKQGDYRKFILPPEGHCFIVADVDSQETKLMTDVSDDPAFLKIYAEGLNPHAYTAARISGVPYKEIIEGKEQDDLLASIYKAGKITNLGENYRMGANTLWNNAHTQWGLTPTKEEVKGWIKVWRTTYRGVLHQWDRFIQRARHCGYAETLAGRRFYIKKWARYKWKSESSAIMLPIQGSGADMKYLAIAAMRQKFPELTFWGEIHDEIIYTAPLADYPDSAETICVKVKKLLDNLPYKKAWGWEPKVPFTWTVSHGLNWKELHDI